MNTENKKSTIGHWITIVILLILLGVSAIANVVLFALTFAGGGIETDSYKSSFNEERILGKGNNKVIQIEAFGIISLQKQSDFFSTGKSFTEKILEQIEAAEKDSNVKAILLVVDSPGGGVTASDIIYERLKKFKSSGDGDRKVVTLMRGLAASGGYYISAASDKIVARKTTITGSIGVILSALNIKELGNKIGLKAVTITSGNQKDMLNPFKDVSAESTNILQKIVNNMQSKFLSIVVDSRNLNEKQTKAISSGRIFSADEALNLNLIDKIGDRSAAIELLKEITGLDKIKLIRYKRTLSFFEVLSSRLQIGTEIPVLSQFKNETPKFQYLWKPEF